MPESSYRRIENGRTRGDGTKAAHLVEIILWAMKANVRVRSVQDDRTGESILDAAVTGTRNYEASRRKAESVSRSSSVTPTLPPLSRYIQT